MRLRALLIVPVLAAVLAGCSTRSQRLYHRAEAFLAQGQVKLAAEEYERLVKEHPRDPLTDDSLYKLAYIYAEEMGKPSLALVRYRRLADRYPTSPYADDALMRVMDIQRTVLHDPKAVAQTYEEVCRRFASRRRLRARALLEVARAQFDGEQYEEAASTTKQLIEGYPAQKLQRSQAALLAARCAERSGGDHEKVVALYEQVVAKYPDTHSAAIAKRSIGWLYYEVKGEEEQKQEQEMRRKSRIVREVPPHGVGAGTGQLQALSVLRSALAHRGEGRSLDELLALSGVAFQVVFDASRPTLGRGIFVDNPFEAIASRLGFACNVWSNPNAEQAFASVHQALLEGHPVIILDDVAPPKWVLVTGYELGEGRVHYLPPGRQDYAVASRETFLSRWASSSREGRTPLAPGPFYQFSLGARLRNPPKQAIVSDTLQDAVEIMRRRELMGAAAGPAAYEKLAEHLELCAAPDATIHRQQALSWATQALPAHLRARDAGTAYLKHAAQVLSGAAGRLNDLAQRHAEVVAETKLLGKQIREAGAEQEQADEKWRVASAQARYVAALETRVAEQMSTVLQSFGGGGG